MSRMIVADTSVWVEFFRARGSREQLELDRLLVQDQVATVGPVIAELLQGARNSQEFERIRDHLVPLPYERETIDTWITVGSLSFQLRRAGVTLGMMDLLIAALALEANHEVYTLDEHFQRVPGLRLHQAGAA